MTVTARAYYNESGWNFERLVYIFESKNHITEIPKEEDGFNHINFL